MSDSNPTPKTVIGPDTHIKGEMTFDSGAVILGRFDGSIEAKGEIEIGESARCSATLRAQRILIDGQVTGDAIASEQVRLNARANVQGDLTATTLVVAEGASFHGMCNVGPGALEQGKPSVSPMQAAAPAVKSDEVRSPRPSQERASNDRPDQPWDRPMVSVNPASSLKAGLSGLGSLSVTNNDDAEESRASA